MQRIKKADSLVFELDPKQPPKLRVKQGESFVVETNDSFAGKMTEPGIVDRLSELPELHYLPVKANPVAGPIYVEGAERGDLLEVTIEKIVVGSEGWTASLPGIGPLGDSHRFAEARGPWVRVIKHLPGPSGTTRDGKASYDGKVLWDLSPMLGVVMVAADREVETPVVGQGPFGGNLDIRDVREGTRVFLNVYHPGGLLYIGDAHGSQGDTEFYGDADETNAEVTASCRVIKRKTIPFIRLEKPDSIVSVYSFRPLEDAVEQAVIGLMEWMMEYGVSERDAYMHMCLNPDFRVNVYQMVKLGRLQYTVGAEMPKKYLRPS
ncbi:MAG: hypothetical protein FJ312_06370 [SAR202 cluster bacterium]|nr:hypothetical protein [SAR202 cluster bacterium]